MSETQTPPIKLPSSDKFNFFLSIVLPISKTNLPPPPDLPVPDNTVFKLKQLCAIAWRVKTWKLTGTITATYTGMEDPPPTIPDLDFDDVDESKNLYDPADDTAISTKAAEMTIINGQLAGSPAINIPPGGRGGSVIYQRIIWENDDWIVNFSNDLGFPPKRNTGINGILMDDDKKLYLNDPLLFVQDKDGIGILAQYKAVSGGDAVSVITAKILGIDIDLIGNTPTDWDLSGHVEITASEWWSWGGAYDTTTGNKT